MESTWPYTIWESINYKISGPITTRLLSIKSQCPSRNNAYNEKQTVLISIENQNDKIKREGLYQDRDKGGKRMTDVEIMIKALRLA